MNNKIFTLENDYLFKRVFSNQLYLKKLLLDFFNVEADNIEYLNTELVKANKNNKVGIVDLLLNIDGEIVIVELQNIDRHNFKERLLFYSSNVIANHCLKVGEDYDQLKNIKVYAIINYKAFNNNVKDIVRLKRNNKIFTKKLEYQIFNLTKVNKNNKDTKYYELVNLFKCHNIKNLEKITNNNLNKEILEIIKNYNLDGEERAKMEDIERLMMNETEHYETAYFDGIEVGRSEGRILGRNEGRNEGISQGINQNKREIAKNLINKNVDIDFIIDVTGLTREQVSSLY